MAATEIETAMAALATLPEPTLVERLDYEVILANAKTTFAASAAARGIDTSEYLHLESAPETILLEALTYAETNLRSRMNVLYRSNLAYFATATDLDHVGDMHGVDRLPGETDNAYRQRIRIWNRGSSAAGPDAWWRHHAMKADVAVIAVGVSRTAYPFPAPGEARGQVTLSILAATPTGAPTPATLAAVEAAVNTPVVWGVTTKVVVRSAIIRNVDVAADVWLLPDAASGTVTALADHVRTTWAARQALGANLVGAWLIAALMRPGVQRVTLTGFDDVIVAPHEAVAIGAVVLTLKGRDY